MRLAMCPKCDETIVASEDGTGLMSIECPYCQYHAVWHFNEDVDILHWYVDEETYNERYWKDTDDDQQDIFIE